MAKYKEPEQISFTEYNRLSDEEKIGKKFIVWDASATSTISNDYVSACAPIIRHRRIYKRKASHCTCCGGALPAIECTDTTELKCPYCDSMIDAVEIIDEEY